MFRTITLLLLCLLLIIAVIISRAGRSHPTDTAITQILPILKRNIYPQLVTSGSHSSHVIRIIYVDNIVCKAQHQKTASVVFICECVQYNPLCFASNGGVISCQGAT